jgi:hypothetical protein
MHTIFLKKTPLFFLFSACLISGCEKPKDEFVEHRVVLANGIDFDSRKMVLVDAETGQLTEPCDPTAELSSEDRSANEKKGSSENGTHNSIKKCAVQFVASDTDPALSTAIELSRKPIEGKIKKNGELVPATYFVVVTALYKGSHCNSTTGAGTSGQSCGRR